MAKIIIADELKNRLLCAAANGSVIAQVVINELKKGTTDVLVSENANYFDSKRVVGNCTDYKSIRIEVTLCNKDLNDEHFPDRGNPQAPYFKENRTSIKPYSFARCFKAIQQMENDRSLLSTEVDYFNSAICVPKKLKIKVLSSMSDIEHAYLADNYTNYAECENLHKSCMRKEDKARNAADFYANFCGAKIMVALDDEGTVYGRAILWPRVECNYGNNTIITSLIDRNYFAFNFVKKMFLAEAPKYADFRKTYDDYSSKKELTCLRTNDIADEGGTITLNLRVCVPQVRWHKKGAPYCDTFTYLYTTSDGQLYISNSNKSGYIASFDYTCGSAIKNKHYCPICGRTHNIPNGICHECLDKISETSEFGLFITTKMKTYNGKKYPIECFDAGRPSRHLINALNIQKLYIS